MPIHARAMTVHQKRQFYRDGFIVLKNAVSEELLEAARSCIRNAKKGDYVGPRKEMLDLLTASDLTPIIHDVMGPFDPPVNCQVAINPVREPGDNYTPLGYRDRRKRSTHATSRPARRETSAVALRCEDTTSACCSRIRK